MSELNIKIWRLKHINVFPLPASPLSGVYSVEKLGLCVLTVAVLVLALSRVRGGGNNSPFSQTPILFYCRDIGTGYFIL